MSWSKMKQNLDPIAMYYGSSCGVALSCAYSSERPPSTSRREDEGDVPPLVRLLNAQKTKEKPNVLKKRGFLDTLIRECNIYIL